ncbi:MAG: hypothetical protein EP343_13375 [Deltaproteobacteria bacterium]|nr:MAG: hypothetical protein EP343_13375 [Deltaproteobacteria bacterium]
MLKKDETAKHSPATESNEIFRGESFENSPRQDLSTQYNLIAAMSHEETETLLSSFEESIAPESFLTPQPEPLTTAKESQFELEGSSYQAPSPTPWYAKSNMTDSPNSLLQSDEQNSQPWMSKAYFATPKTPNFRQWISSTNEGSLLQGTHHVHAGNERIVEGLIALNSLLSPFRPAAGEPCIQHLKLQHTRWFTASFDDTTVHLTQNQQLGVNDLLQQEAKKQHIHFAERDT